MWKRGEKAELARAVELSPQRLNDILSGAKPCPRRKAIELERQSKEVLGYIIPIEDWLLNKETKNPHFHNGS